MKFAFLSDPHLESQRYSTSIDKMVKLTSPDAILCAGDVGPLFDRLGEINFYWTHLLSSLKVPFYYVIGNHDAYNSSYEAVIEEMDKLSKKYPNFIPITNKVVQLDDDVVLIGATLFSDFSLYGDGSMTRSRDVYYYEFFPDFRLIRRQDGSEIPVTVDDYINFHNRDVKFIQDAIVANQGKKIVIVTHWMPSEKAIVSKYIGDPFNPYFVTNVAPKIVTPDVKYWIYGHGHTSMNFSVDTTEFFNNSVGYSSELSYFQPTATIEL